MERKILRSDGQLHFHKGQRRAWESDKRFIAVISGTQAGKTSFAPWWLWREISLLGPGDYIAATATYDLFKLKLLPAIRHTFEHAAKWGRYWAGDKIMELSDPETGKFLAKRQDDEMWGRIILRSAQSEGGLESATAKAAILDEWGQDDVTLENWQAVLRRLSIHRGRALITTTPYNLGWLKTSFYDFWDAGDKDYDVIQFESIENPIFPKDEFARARRTMDDWAFDMFYRGLLSKPGHLIYKCIDESVIVEPFAIPAEWKRRVGVDFGGANTALVWLAENPETGVWYVHDESLEGGLSTKEHTRRAKKKSEGLANSAVFFRWSAIGNPRAIGLEH